ncbi:MAG: lipopolysaccharide heptosyltransferase II [Oceanospirillales bacterium LUC14_002_19_P2]|nr:MAG: lipopolysaccharide heptosyltransferase II [Oceanospirillales bacterium LUC14_002_19_P2]
MKYLIVGPSWVGDMVMAQTLFITLKQQYPSAVIDVLVPAWSRPLLARMPEVRQGLDMPLGHGSLNLSVRRRLGKQLAAEGYDQAIILPNSFKSALIPFWAGIPKRTGWRGEMRYGLLNDLRILDKTVLPLMIQRFIALGYPKGSVLPESYPAPALVADSDNANQALKTFNLSLGRPVLALCSGAEFGPAKRWPEQHFAAIANERLGQSWQVWLFGSQKDEAVCNSIVQQVPQERQANIHNLAGKTQLADAIDLLSLSDEVVSNDSGLMHIAAALSRNLVVVYGSTSPGFTPPLNPNSVIVQSTLSCSPCFQRTCPQQHTDCLKQLSPSQVLTALEQLADRSTVREMTA